MAMQSASCYCGDSTCPGCNEIDIESTDFPYTEDALRAYISDLVDELKYPMTANLKAAKTSELGEWILLLRTVEAAGRAPQFEKAMAETTIQNEKDAANAG